MNTNDILNWIKANLLIVIFAVLMIGALVYFPWQASQLNAGVQERMERRQAKLRELESFERTSFTDPLTGETHQVVINESLLEQYRRVINEQTQDAERIREQAVSFNKQDHRLIAPQNWSDPDGVGWLFPEPPSHEREVRPRQFHELLMERYDQLLNDLNAGTPPSLESLREDLDREEAQFRSNELQKSLDADLAPEEKQALQQRLGNLRLAKYSEAADRIGIYLNKGVLGLPGLDNSSQLAEMFLWQWQYWIIEDLLQGLTATASDRQSVRFAPVKRIVSIELLDEQISGGSTGSGGAGTAAGGSRSRPGAQRGGPPGGGDAPPAAASASGPISPDYARSITGLHSNSRFDVWTVRIFFIAETERLPEVLDNLVRENFFSIVDLQLEPHNPYPDAELGYFYGSEPLVAVRLDLNTVWLREWTSEFMPVPLKQELGIPVQQSANQPPST